ncbi:MAG: ATP-binding protein, partial [Cytophagaceae bacterium]
MTQRARFAPPRASAMLEALRGLGYSTAAALADVIDNSVSAGASDVYVRFDWNEESSRVSILDDGRGMSDQELEAAMTLGAKNPLDE